MTADYNRRIVPDTDSHTHLAPELVVAFDRSRLAAEVRNANWDRMP